MRTNLVEIVDGVKYRVANRSPALEPTKNTTSATAAQQILEKRMGQNPGSCFEEGPVSRDTKRLAALTAVAYRRIAIRVGEVFRIWRHLP